MKKRLIYLLSILLILFGLGAGLAIHNTNTTARNLESVINLHQIEIIRQNLVINAQTVQQNVFTIGTAFGKELDIIVENVTALDNSIEGCLGCHHKPDMTQRLKDIHELVGQYKDALSYLITTSANPERVERLKMVTVGVGDSILSRTSDMALIAEKNLNKKTLDALTDIKHSRTILIATLFLAFVIAIVIAMKLTNQITRPVSELVNSVRMIAGGEIGYKTSYTDNTEFGELASNFNLMSESLKEKHERTLLYIKQLSGLYNVTLSFYRLADIEEIYKEICQEVATLLDAGQCLLVLYDNNRGMFTPRSSSSSLTEEIVKSFSIPPRKIDELYKLSNGLPIIVNSPDVYERFSPITSNTPGEHSVVAAWLSRKDEVLGLLRVSGKAGIFTDEDAKLLTILAGHMAVAMENARLYKDLQNQMVELRDAQEQLIQSAKLAAIGELASNVAHEINNPLTSIIGFTELIKDETNVNIIKDRLTIIEKESLRARDIVRQLLGFAKKRPLQLVEVDINETVKELLPLIESPAKLGNVTLNIDEDRTLPKTTGDPNQLKQVFINIINNAIAAMHEGGKLNISTLRLGEYIIIRFEDAGPGIPKDILNRIFEPFFSTKREKGTGLGLSISYRIIQDHGGRIDVESEVGKGTTFSIRLPIRSPEKA